MTSRNLIKSRSFLQAISNDKNEYTKHQIIESIIDTVWRDITKNLKPSVNSYSLKPGRVGLIYDTARQFFPDGVMSEPFSRELIEALKKEYPDCKFLHMKCNDRGGNVIEELIIIDWS